MANTNCSVKISQISSAFISKDGNELLSNMKAPRYVDYINFLFGKVFKDEYLNNDSFLTLSDFTDGNNKLTVSGSLNNLYTEVRKKLAEDVNNPSFLLDLPQDIKNQTYSDLIKILENWKLFVDYHSKYNAYINIRPEDIEEKEDVRFDKKGNEHTEFDLITNDVRTLFKFFPQTTLVREGDNLIGVPVINPTDGLPVRGDFENIFKLTLDALKGIKDENKFIEKITSEEVLTRIPELYFLFEILPFQNGIENFTNKQKLLFNQFFIVMSRDYIPVHASIFETRKKDLPNHYRFASARSNIDKIERQFISNFLSNLEENEYIQIQNDIDDTNTQNSVYGKRRLTKLPAKLPLISLSLEDMNSLTPRKIRNQYKAYFDFFKLIGIEFSDFSLLTDFKSLINILNSALIIHDNLSLRLNNKIPIYNPLQDLKQPLKKVLNNKPINIISLKNTLKNIYKFEGKISKITPTLVTKAANGENQADITFSNAISIAASQISSVNSLEELYTKSYFKKLKYNPLHKISYVGRNVIPNKNIIYSIENYSGNTFTDENGDSKSFDTKSMSDVRKFISDFNNLLGWGTINTVQLESKAGFFAVKYYDKAADKNILPFHTNQFENTFITNNDFGGQILNYLYGEIERVKSFKNVQSYAPKAYGEFHIFKNLLSEDNKINILKDKNTIEYKKAEAEALQNINIYFENEVENLKNFITKNNIENFISEKTLSEANITKELFNQNIEKYTDNLLRSFIANDFVHNVEFGIYVSGDPLFYKDYHKRLGGLSSVGTQPVTGSNIKNYFNSDSEKIFWNNFSLRGILNQLSTENKKQERRDNMSNYLSAVLAEDNVKENTLYQNDETIQNYIYSVKLNLGKDITEEQARKDLKINQIENSGIDIGDGQGYLNLDAARELSIKQGIHRPQQDVAYRFEALIFKQMLLAEKGENLNEDELKLLAKEEKRILQNPDKYALPTLKQTYYGTLSNEDIQIDAKVFDKFSLSTLLPSTARNHPKLKELLLAMAKRQIHYVKYKSGTKGFVRKTFKDAKELSNENNELDILESNLLKLQITPSKSEKISTKIPTQKIKLLFTNLFGDNTSESVIQLRNQFLSDLNNIKDYNRKAVLKDLGFVLDDNNNIVNWNKEKIVDALITQVNLQKLPTPILKALETDENGNFINTLESSDIYKNLLNYVVGKLDSKLREYKVNGGDFVLLSESMYDTPLQYFRLAKNKKSILPCECRLTLTKEYVKLLELEYKGEKIGTVNNLNKLLKQPTFRDKFKKELTVTFSRPPVQGPNSMGVAIITEFFYPTAGNILQLPKEFMHQAGIDFDYDKEKVLIPTLLDNGKYLNEENLSDRDKTLKSSDYFKDLVSQGRDANLLMDYLNLQIDNFESQEDYEEAKESMLKEDNVLKLLLNVFGTNIEDLEKNLTDISRDIRDYLNVKNKEKALITNKLIDTIIKSLGQPEIYSELILPNTDTTVKPLALQNGREINNLNTLPTGVDVYSYLQNLKVFKLFNDAKALLGPFALHNVFMELIAPLNIKLNLDYAYNNKGVATRKVNLLLSNNKDRTVNISERYDSQGNIKQHITSEFINATVDSAKDPYFANFLLSFDNINTHTYLQALHYPVEIIEDFISSAVVRKYLSYKSKDNRKEDALNMTLSDILPRPLKRKATIEDILAEDIKRIDSDNSNIINNLKILKSDNSLDKNGPYYLENVALLSNFIAMEEHATQFGYFKSLFNNDTNKTSSLYEISSKEALKRSVINTGMFSSQDITKIEQNSTISAYRNDDLIKSVLKTVFPLFANELVYNSLGNLFSSSKPNLNAVDKRILSDIITNDYIGTILYSYGEYNNQNFFEYGRNLVTKEKLTDGSLTITLLERLYKLKQNKEYGSLIKQFPVLTKILSEVTRANKNRVYNYKYAYNTFLNIDPNLPIFEKEAYMAQFEQIINGEFNTENPLVKSALINFTKDFFIAGLIQSGLNKSSLSYIEYMPKQFLQELLNSALSKYNGITNNTTKLSSFLTDFNLIFTYNNPKYFNISREDRPRITKQTHLGKYLYNYRAPLADKIIDNISKAKSVKDFVNHTGGAELSDTKWDLIGREYGFINHNHYREPGQTEVDSAELKQAGIKATPLSENDYNEGQPKATIAARQMGRIAPTYQVRSNYIIRNWAQVKYADAIYALGKIILKGTSLNHGKTALIDQVSGGTGYAVQMAINEGKPVYVFDGTKDSWFVWNGSEFAPTTTPILTKNYAGIGSRTLSPESNVEKSLQAIRDVYENTLADLNINSNPNLDLSAKVDPIILQSGFGVFKNALSQEEHDIILQYALKQFAKQGYHVKKAVAYAHWGKMWAVNDKGNAGFPIFGKYLKKDENGKIDLPIANINSAELADNPNAKAWYNYYLTDQNGNKLEEIPQEIKNIIKRTTGYDVSDHDAAIINAYADATVLTRHIDNTEDTTARNKAIVSINLLNPGTFFYGEGSPNSTNTNPDNKEIELNPRDIAIFGDKSRFMPHRVDVGSGNTIHIPLADGTTGIDARRINITIRRVMPININTQENLTENLNKNVSTDFRKNENEIVNTDELEVQDENVNLEISEEVGSSLSDRQNEEQLQPSINYQPNFTFTYNNKTIDTNFELGAQQAEALKALIDFSNSRDMFITLQGAAGTGKTTIIGYLEKYLKGKYSFAYMAPTHAATAELAFATVKTGNDYLPSTLQSAITLNSKTKKHVFTRKIQERIGYNPMLVLDEASMIDQSDITKLEEALEDVGGKLIFLGDEKQISKVDSSNKETKQVSPAFVDYSQVRLTKIYRQSDNSLLNLLSAMREQNTFKLFKVPNSNNVKFLNRADFNKELVQDLINDPENTVLITYTNNSVKSSNIGMRSILGRTGQTIVGDIVVGYLGYASKQIEKQDLANSVSYTIIDIKKENSVIKLRVKSQKLTNLINSGVRGISDEAFTDYYQLNKSDALTFDELNQNDFDKNNKILSELFKKMHEANVAMANKELNYNTYLSIVAGFSDKMRKYSVGDDYIYNPTSNKMEKFDSNKHRHIKQNGQGSLLLNKDVDYGHAITIHKSQGATIGNVYFDSNSLNAARNTPVLDKNNNQITTEKMSLAYVGMSRSKNKLVVYEADNNFELLGNENQINNNSDLNDIGFTKKCN